MLLNLCLVSCLHGAEVPVKGQCVRACSCDTVLHACLYCVMSSTASAAPSALPCVAEEQRQRVGVPGQRGPLGHTPAAHHF